MMSCPLPMTLPIISSSIHSDFSPVHVGVKNKPSKISRQQMQLLQATSAAQTTATGAAMLQHPFNAHHMQQTVPTFQAAAAFQTTMLQHHHQQQQQQQQQFFLQQQQQQQHQQQQQQMLQAYMQLQVQAQTAATPATPTKFQAQTQQQQYFAAAAAAAAAAATTPLALMPTAAACNNAAAVAAAAAAAMFANEAALTTTASVSAAATTALTTPCNIFHHSNNVNNNIILSATNTSSTTATAAAAVASGSTAQKMPSMLLRPKKSKFRNQIYNAEKNLNGDTIGDLSLLGAAPYDDGASNNISISCGNSSSSNNIANPTAIAVDDCMRSGSSLVGSSCSSASSECSMPSPSSLHLSSPKKPNGSNQILQHAPSNTNSIAIQTQTTERGSDELLSQAAVMAPASDNNNQDLATKKAKLETSAVLGGVCKPSKVIHLRNIPNESSEPDVISLGVPFGRVTNVLILKGKNQAFLEMADEVSASAMVSCYTVTPPQMRGRMVYVQFSNHRELKTDQNHGNAIQSDYRIQSPASGSPLPLCGNAAATNNADGTAVSTAVAVLQNNTNAVNAASGNATSVGGPNTVLRVIVESLLYPVSLDILHQIFQRFGKVLKIVTFTKNNSFQALIQYPDAHSAQHAKTILDGQNIYNGCCTLRIDNSKLTALNVKYNNDKSRDFTNPSLPPGEPGADIMPTAGGLVNANDLLLIAARQRPSLTGDKLVNGLGAPGVLPPFPLGIGTPLAGGYSSGIPNLGAFALANSSALQTAAPALRGFSNVLLVSNLNEEMVTPDALFTLFGVYGDVQRVKILYNKKDSALIQMAEPQQAYLAMTHLDKLRLWGKAIRVMASKHQAVQLPKEGQPDAGLTRDYSQNPLHRFKKPGSKNYQNIYPPSATLHLSNIPSSCSEDDIKAAFTSNNFEVKAFKFFPKDRKMALLQLSSVEEAVLALIKMHNHQLSESNHLRVSFSKSNI